MGDDNFNLTPMTLESPSGEWEDNLKLWWTIHQICNRGTMNYGCGPIKPAVEV